MLGGVPTVLKSVPFESKSYGWYNVEIVGVKRNFIIRVRKDNWDDPK